jgi:hypothetical protein
VNETNADQCNTHLKFYKKMIHPSYLHQKSGWMILRWTFLLQFETCLWITFFLFVIALSRATCDFQSFRHVVLVFSRRVLSVPHNAVVSSVLRFSPQNKATNGRICYCVHSYKLYTVVTWDSSVNGGDKSARGFLLSAYCCIPFQAPSDCSQLRERC